MNTIHSELIQKHIDTFPVLPETVTRLMNITSDAACSVKDVVRTIESDQSLCLTVLKIANSVLFGRPRKADSIKMAVVILGFDEVQRIALAKALINSFGKLAKQHKPFIDKFWQHCFVCGMAAKCMAADLTINPGIAFTGGILHDIGKLIMLETFADDYAIDHWTTHYSTVERLHEELELFSFTHDMVGGRLLRKWLFPENLISAVAYHHRPEAAVWERDFAYLTQLADLLSFYCCNPVSLGDDDIVTVIYKSLPEIQSQWLEYGLPLSDEAIAGWFDWLVKNHEQSRLFNEAYSV